MIKTIITISLGIILNISPVFAQKVYLLTSLKVDKKPVFSRASWDYNQKLEKIFKKKTTDFNYKIVVQHQVSPSTLEKILKDEETIGVFWVSHGSRDKIKDMYGNNIKTMFLNLVQLWRIIPFFRCPHCSSSSSV